MTDSVPIPLDVLAETQAALDAALVVAQDSPETYGKVLRAKANLGDCLSNKSIRTAPNCDSMKLKRKALHAIALLHDVANGLEG
jgi:hypothetical protein